MDCYGRDDNSRRIEVVLGCPYRSNNFTVRLLFFLFFFSSFLFHVVIFLLAFQNNYSSLFIHANSFPALSFCQLITINLWSASLFEQPYTQSLSSEVKLTSSPFALFSVYSTVPRFRRSFYRNRRTNFRSSTMTTMHSWVRSSPTALKVYCLLSHGLLAAGVSHVVLFSVSWNESVELEAPMKLCIGIDKKIPQASFVFTSVGFAILSKYSPSPIASDVNNSFSSLLL